MPGVAAHIGACRIFKRIHRDRFAVAPLVFEFFHRLIGDFISVDRENDVSVVVSQRKAEMLCRALGEDSFHIVCKHRAYKNCALIDIAHKIQPVIIAVKTCDPCAVFVFQIRAHLLVHILSESLISGFGDLAYRMVVGVKKEKVAVIIHHTHRIQELVYLIFYPQHFIFFGMAVDRCIVLDKLFVLKNS